MNKSEKSIQSVCGEIHDSFAFERDANGDRTLILCNTCIDICKICKFHGRATVLSEHRGRWGGGGFPDFRIVQVCFEWFRLLYESMTSINQ
jgi:hypothetical protein